MINSKDLRIILTIIISMKNIRVLTADTVVKKKAYNAKRLKKKKFEKKL